jgi:hypothetical protein
VKLAEFSLKLCVLRLQDFLHGGVGRSNQVHRNLHKNPCRLYKSIPTKLLQLLCLSQAWHGHLDVEALQNVEDGNLGMWFEVPHFRGRIPTTLVILEVLQEVITNIPGQHLKEQGKRQGEVIRVIENPSSNDWLEHDSLLVSVDAVHRLAKGFGHNPTSVSWLEPCDR